jgi:vanillate O-demethylase ferredoxin subunit
MAATHTAVWQRARVSRTRPLAPAIVEIELEVEHPVKVEAGAHLDVRVPLDAGPDRRSYSLVGASPDGSRVTVSVYRSPISRGAAAVMHGLQPGDELEVTQPMQDFPLRVGAPSYVLLAGGIGVTAIFGMARVLRDLGAAYRLIYAGRSRGQMAYLDDLIDTHGDRISVHVRDEGTSLAIPDLVAGIDADTEFYMCGPIRMMDEVRRSWIDRGLRLPNLRFETFGNSGWHEPQEFRVTIPRLGVSTVVRPDETMLEALEAAGADLMYDCRKGECGLCEARILELDGDIDHRDVFYSERQKDATSRMCCCVSRVAATRGGGSAGVVIEVS